MEEAGRRTEGAAGAHASSRRIRDGLAITMPNATARSFSGVSICWYNSTCFTGTAVQILTPLRVAECFNLPTRPGTTMLLEHEALSY